MRTDAKLTALCQYLGERIDASNKTESEFDRGLYIAYSIARIKLQDILFEMLDKQLADSLSQDDGECV